MLLSLPREVLCLIFSGLGAFDLHVSQSPRVMVVLCVSGDGLVPPLHLYTQPITLHRSGFFLFLVVLVALLLLPASPAPVRPAPALVHLNC